MGWFPHSDPSSGDEVLIQSRDEKSLNRYFPELIERLRAQLPKH
jgi:hypothetical protein